MKNSWAYAIAIGWTLFIATSCFLPPSAFQHFSWSSLFELDKFIHLFIFFILAIVWLLTIKPKPSSGQKWMVLIICSVYGLLIELIQSTKSIGRSYETGDVIADTIGVILGVIAINWIIKWLPFIKKYLPFMNKVY